MEAVVVSEAAKRCLLGPLHSSLAPDVRDLVAERLYTVTSRDGLR